MAAAVEVRLPGDLVRSGDHARDDGASAVGRPRGARAVPLVQRVGGRRDAKRVSRARADHAICGQTVEALEAAYRVRRARAEDAVRRYAKRALKVGDARAAAAV